jgi:ATP-dependent RNA helicase DeaD
MGREGVAYTFVTPEEGNELTRIEIRIDRLLKRAEMEGFEALPALRRSAVAPAGDSAETPAEGPLEPLPPKPVFGRPVRRVRRAL